MPIIGSRWKLRVIKEGDTCKKTVMVAEAEYDLHVGVTKKKAERCQL
jgi:hypothetical protein